jgi:hypothetical protein
VVAVAAVVAVVRPVEPLLLQRLRRQPYYTFWGVRFQRSGVVTLREDGRKGGCY